MRKGVCKFFNGAHHNPQCEGGVAYADVTPDWNNRTGRALRLPCHTEPYPNATPSQMEQFNRRGTCAKYTEPTEAEIAEHERETQAVVDRMMKTMPLIERVKREHRGQDWSGAEKCPVCGKPIHLSHSSYNGHVSGRCETDDCIAFME